MTKLALNAISKEKHLPRRHEEKQKRTFFWFPSSSSRRYTQISQSPSFWHGLPESRLQGRI